MQAAPGNYLLPSSEPNNGRGLTLASAFLVLAVMLTAAGCGSNSGSFAGVWTAAEGFGGLLIDQNGETYEVTLVDAQGHQSTPQTTSLKGGRLQITLKRGELPLPQGPHLIEVAARLVVSGDPASNLIRLDIKTPAGGESLDLKRVDEILLDTSSPSSVPSVTDFTPPPTPHALLTGDFKNERDAQVAANTYALQVAIERFMADRGMLPEERDVSLVGVVSHYLDPWPANPYTAAGGPMLAGDLPGEFTYSTDADGYLLTGHLDRGDEFTLKGNLRNEP